MIGSDKLAFSPVQRDDDLDDQRRAGDDVRDFVDF